MAAAGETRTAARAGAQADSTPMARPKVTPRSGVVKDGLITETQIWNDSAEILLFDMGA